MHSEIWNEARFLEAGAEWQELLSNSDGDPLFLSWHWMQVWWNIFRRGQDRLHIVAAYRSDKLIGLAPLYLNRGRDLKGRLPVRRLEMLGCRTGDHSGLRSEYLGFLLHRGHVDEALSQLLGDLQALAVWQEARFQDIPQQSPLTEQLSSLGMLREITHQKAYSVNTRGQFADYLKQLGRNSRLKLFNRRKLLEKMGRIQLKQVQAAEIDRLIDALNDFDRLRFGHDSTMSDQARRQMHALQASMPGLSITEHSSLLYLDDQLLSVIINFRLGGRIYNMQLGYQQDFHRKISLGTLHLGYAIEAAFEDPEVDCFDFLLGEGKNSDYKRHLATDRLTASSWQVIRSPLLKLLYRVNDEGKRLIRRVGGN